MGSPQPQPFSNLGSLLGNTQWPVMPEVAQALIRTLHDDDADMFTVCQIIGQDPALTTHLLRMANSAMFGLSGTVNTLERAVNVVGMNMVRARAVVLCIARICDFPIGMDRMTFWQYSLRFAWYAQWLAERCDVNDQEAWLCGMMLRLGEINMASARPGCLLKIEAQPIAPGERWLRQRRIIGFTEGEIIAELARLWDFPSALVTGLRHCAQPLNNRDFSRLAGVLHLAARLADGGAFAPNNVEQLPDLLLHVLQLDCQTLLDNPPLMDDLDTGFFDY